MTVTTSSAFRRLLITIGLAIVLTACGGSSSDNAETSDSDATTTTAEATTTTVAETTTTVAETTTTTTTTAAPAEVDPSDPIVVAYCTASAEADAVTDATNPNDPDAFRELIDYQIEALSAVEAPEVIGPDVETILAGVAQYPAILEPVGFDITAAADQIQAIAESDEFVAASDRIDAFEDEYCPEPDIISPSTTDNPLGITDDDIRELLDSAAGREGIASGVASTTNLDEAEALCFVESTSPDVLIELFAIGTGGSVTPSPDVLTGMVAGLDACGLPLTALTG